MKMRLRPFLTGRHIWERGIDHPSPRRVRDDLRVLWPDVFGLWVWSQERKVDQEDADLVVAKTGVSGGRYGLMMRTPDWDGDLGLDEDAATEWIQDAATRWGGSSV